MDRREQEDNAIYKVIVNLSLIEGWRRKLDNSVVCFGCKSGNGRWRQLAG
jgi:hypothetical protein